jgi:hypothetical protein
MASLVFNVGKTQIATVLQLVYDGISWYEASRSVN